MGVNTENSMMNAARALTQSEVQNNPDARLNEGGVARALTSNDEDNVMDVLCARGV